MKNYRVFDSIKTCGPLVDLLRIYHRHTVVGLENLPRTRGALVVCNHSLATYDMTVLARAVMEETGRVGVALADRLFFRIPVVKNFVSAAGAYEGSPETARQLLEDDNLVFVAPGGMREALRPSNRRYEVDWEGRKGFVRIAIDTGSPIILAACPAADDLYNIYGNLLTRVAYERFRFPLPFARGFGPTVLPKPVRLVHHLSEPFLPPVKSVNEKEYEIQVERFHRRLETRMQDLLAQGVAADRRQPQRAA